MITIENGYPQSPGGLIVPLGSISFQLNIDATIIAAPGGFVCADIPVVFQFDKNGALIQPAQLWSNEELNPQNSIGLGTYYLVTFYDQHGARLNTSPMWWQFIEAANSTVDISQMTPFATIGGNVIFYPTSFTVPPPTPTTLGGVFSNAGIPGEFVSAINTDGTVTISAPVPAGSNTDVQFNDGGLFGGASQFTWDKVHNVAAIGTTQPTPPNYASFPPASVSLFVQQGPSASFEAAAVIYNYNNLGTSNALEVQSYGVGTTGFSYSVITQAACFPGMGNTLIAPISGTGHNACVAGVYGYASLNGLGEVQILAGVASFCENLSTGTIDLACAYLAQDSPNDIGTMTAQAGLYIQALSSAVANTGIYIEDMGLGSANFAIKVVGGKTYLGGPVNIVPPVLGASTYVFQIDGTVLTQTTDTLIQLNSPATIHNMITFAAGGGAAVLQMSPGEFSINVTNGDGILSVGSTGLEFDTTQSSGSIVFKEIGSSSWNFTLDTAVQMTVGNHSETCVTGQATELLTLSTIAAFTDTAANLLPANSIIDSVVVRVTQTISGGSTPTTWEAGDATTAARFISTGNALTANTTAVGLNQMQGSVTTDAAGPVQTAAAKVRITLDQTPGQGIVRITVFYRQFTAPTS